MATTTSRPSHAPNVVLIVGTAPTTPRIRSRVRLLPETPTPPDTSRNRPAGAPLRPPVIDGIEEFDQDSELDNALHIEKPDRHTDCEIRRPRGSCSSPVEGLRQIRLRNAARSRATLSATTHPILWGLIYLSNHDGAGADTHCACQHQEREVRYVSRPGVDADMFLGALGIVLVCAGGVILMLI